MGVVAAQLSGNFSRILDNRHEYNYIYRQFGREQTGDCLAPRSSPNRMGKLTRFGLMFRAAVIESNELAAELGPFPRYKECVWDSDIMRAHFPQEEIDRMKVAGLRNCSLISIAPTGSIATMLGESGGCEPEFAMKCADAVIADNAILTSVDAVPSTAQMPNGNFFQIYDNKHEYNYI